MPANNYQLAAGMITMKDRMNEASFEGYFDNKLDEYLRLLEQMVDINSFTENGNGINSLGNITRSNFAKLGYSSTTIPSRNPLYGDHLVLSKIAADGKLRPSIGLVSHLDTVFSHDEEKRNDFFWRVDGDRIYGPGTVDIKGGTILIYMVMDGLRQLEPEIFNNTNWYILLNAAEETLEQEFGEICRLHLPEDTLACLVFEGGRLQGNQFSIVTARKGMATFQIEVEGKAAHAGSAHRTGANAIVQLARLVTKISDLTDYSRRLTVNVGTIAGGTVTNRVPHIATAKGEMRAFELDVLEQGVTRLQELHNFQSVQSMKGGFRCRVTVNIENIRRPWTPNQHTEGLFSIWQEAATELGWEVARQERGGLSDGNWVWDYVPTLDGLGPSGGNAHCSERNEDRSKDQEYIQISSFVPKAILNARAIIKLLRSHGLP